MKDTGYIARQRGVTMITVGMMWPHIAVLFTTSLARFSYPVTLVQFSMSYVD